MAFQLLSVLRTYLVGQYRDIPQWTRFGDVLSAGPSFKQWSTVRIKLDGRRSIFNAPDQLLLGSLNGVQNLVRVSTAVE